VLAILVALLAVGRPVDPPAAPGAMAPNLPADGDTVWLTWLEPAGAGHRMQIASLGPAGWSAARTVAEGDDFFANWADVPSVVRAGDGSLIAHRARRTGAGKYAYEVRLSRSTDGGATWRDLGPAHDDATAAEHGFVSIVARDAGALAIWLDGRETAKGGPTTLRAARVDGDRVGPDRVVDARVCDCCGTSAALTAEGPIVAYRDRGDREVRDVQVARFTGGRWLPPRTVHADGWEMPGCPVNGPVVRAVGRHVAVGWFTGAGGARVRVAFSEDAGSTFGAPVEIDARAPLGRVDLTLAPGGDAIVSWLATDGLAPEKAAVRLRRVAPDGRLGPVLDVAETVAARSAGFPRMAQMGGDLLVVWTQPGEVSRVRAARLPLDAVPAARETLPPSAAEAPAMPRDLPAYSAPTPDGRPFALRDAAGSVVLVNLWATWCLPCRAELPVLARLHAAHAARGLRIVGVSVDEDAGALRRHLAAEPLPYTVLHDPEGAGRAFGASVVPATRLYDRVGRLVWSRDGVFSPDEPDFLAALQAALGAPAR
jgi:thiol-disulfide isomerase/thioredoxin